MSDEHTQGPRDAVTRPPGSAAARPSRGRELATFGAVLVASMAVMATSPRRWQLSSRVVGAPLVVSAPAGASADVVVTVTPAPAATEPMANWRVGVTVTAKTSLRGDAAGSARVRLSLQPSGAASALKEVSLPAPEVIHLYAQEFLGSCAPSAPCERRLKLRAEPVSGGAVEVTPEVDARLEGLGASPPAGASIGVRVVPLP